MAGDGEYHDEIQALIDPWRHVDEMPPFSWEELIALALTLHKKPLTSQSIMKWITSTFDFYHNMAFEALWAQHTGDADDKEGILQDFFDALNSLDLPVTTSGDHEDANGVLYQMSTAAIQWVLSHEIAEKRNGTFPFLRLPAELRTCIYDMVLSYLRSGLNPQGGRSSTGRRSTYFVAATRDVTQKFTFGLWYDNDPELQVSPPSQILALLRVNKQIFAEASACFYRINIFYCGDSETTLDTLKSLVPSRRQHLRHLTFFYDPRNSASGNELFELLVSLPNLRKLDIHLDERRLFRSRVPRKRR
jgi:hypothetical protein